MAIGQAYGLAGKGKGGWGLMAGACLASPGMVQQLPRRCALK